MTSHKELITLSAKTDRELLVMVVQVINDKIPAIDDKLGVINSRCPTHDKRIRDLEIAGSKESQAKPGLYIRWQMVGGGIIALVGSLIYAMGKGLGWW